MQTTWWRKDVRDGVYLVQLNVNNEEHRLRRKDHKGQTTAINTSIRVIFVTSRSFLRSVLSFVSSQVCGPSSLLLYFLLVLARARN